MPATDFGEIAMGSHSAHDESDASTFPENNSPPQSEIIVPPSGSNNTGSGSSTSAPNAHAQKDAAAGPGAEVVVSGMSGRLPESENLAEFRDNLMGGVDMVTEDGRRWTPGLHGLPTRNGKLKDISKFDAGFFGVSGKQANGMDPQLRLLLEVTYEAIVDAGVNPTSVRGSRTGVYVGTSWSEAQDAWTTDMDEIAGYEMTGGTRSMFANRLSYFFDFKGPSYAIDTACSSSLLALHQALTAIRNDECDAAIVAGCHVVLKPATSLQFQRLGMLAPDGSCKSFDASGNGYVRSEAVVSVYLQRAPNAKRIYATLVHSKTNTDGHKSQGITFPNGAIQKRLLESVYRESGVDPAAVSYMEAHGTGTKVGDPQEVNTIADVFCRKGRKGPLLIGSTKSNMGHPEPASGLAALAKILISMEEKQLPPNLHFKNPNPDIPALIDRRLKVVTERTPWNGGYAAVSSFGFGGANVHVLLKSHVDETVTTPHPAGKVPRLLTISGRTDKGVESVMSTVEKQAENVALHALLQESSSATTVQSHPVRGYSVLNNGNNATKEIQAAPVSRGPVWFVFAGMGTQWHGMGRALMALETFRASIQRSHAVLSSYGIALRDLIMKDGPEAFEETLNAFVCIAAIQVALVDVLRSLGITPDGIVGHSVGELGCAYADGCMTASETVLAAYWRGRCVKEANLPPGGMAAVGLTWEEAKKRCPEGVAPACHNSLDTITISGPKEAVSKFVAQLKEEGVFAKEVNSAGVAFHSCYMARTAPALKKALHKVIREPRKRTSRWISSSIPKSMWGSELARYSSAEYHVNNLLSPVLFQEALENVPKNAVVIEIAPHCLLQAILKRSLGSECTFVGLMKRNHPDNMEYFLSNLGKLYTAGVDFNPMMLHPTPSPMGPRAPVRFPVPAGTPMVSPLVRWDHGASWNVPTMDQLMGGSGGSGAGCVYEVDIGEDSDDHYLVGHRIDGRVLYPATGYMVLAWRSLGKITGNVWTDMPVCFEDVAIHRATIMPDEGKVKFEVSVSPDGHFEVVESDGLVASGRIYQPEEPHTVPEEEEVRPQWEETAPGGMRLTGKDVYKELRLRGYDYGATFQGVLSAEEEGEEGFLSWSGNWVSFLDTMLQFQILSSPGSTLRLPTRIKSLKVNPKQQAERVMEVEDGKKAIKALVDSDLSTVYAGGVELLGLHTTVAPRRPNSQASPVLEEYSFVPYTQENLCGQDTALVAYLQKCEAVTKSMGETSLCENLKEELQGLLHSNDQMDIQDVDVEKDGQKCILLKLLQEIGQVTKPEDAKEIIEDNKDLQEDCLFSALINSPAFKTCIDVVRENLSGEKIKITEVSAEQGRLFKQIVPQLLLEPQLELEYIAATAGTSSSSSTLDATLLEELGVEEAKWDWSSNPSGKVANANLVIANNVLHVQNDISQALKHLQGLLNPTNGYLLIKELTSNLGVPTILHKLINSDAAITDSDRIQGPFCDVPTWRKIFTDNGLEVVAQKSDGLTSTLFLCKVRSDPTEETSASTKVLHCDSLEYKWVEELKEAVVSPEVHRLWLVSEELNNTGLVGLVNCLRQEPGGDKIRCVVGTNDAAALAEVQKKDLAMNVYSDGQWGSYRHIVLPKGVEPISREHAYVNVLTRGDLSSLAWIESPMKHHDPESHPDHRLVNVNYTALNFRDVMLATGKLPADAIPGDLASQDCILGMEVAGTEHGTGRRVMGLLSAKGLASSVSVDKRFLWDVPATWSLEEASSVPVVYTTAYYALVVRGRIRRGETVLIHSGSGGVGQAAIAIALHTGCRVFTTVGSPAKRQYLLNRFPALTDACFANSRDTSFEKHVLKATRGRGVDVVLNSLAEDKLHASIRCLAQHGRFLEIGKMDLSNNSALGMSIFLRNITFHGILLDALFDGATAEWGEVAGLLSQGIRDGAVQPLQTSTFTSREVEDAFRFMAQGKHIGKVVIQVSEENALATRPSIPCLPRVSCNPKKSYIITGGLGGFGLELAGWLVERGARKLVLTSRAGRARNGFQARRLRALRASGVSVTVSARDVATEEEAKALVQETENQMGEIGGLFHLAMVLQDGFLENQSAETFTQVGASKVSGTANLDKALRSCHAAEKVQQQQQPWFVVFSSVSCGRGNAGQSSYGYANSYMERLMEARQRDGLHGVAIQWGAIGDVGVIQDSMGGDNDTVIGGTLPQRIGSCLDTLDRFLNEPHQAVLSSFVPAGARKVKGVVDGAGGKSLADSVAHILGMKDVSSINPSVSLGDLGLDSLMGVEVKQCLERADIVLRISEVRALTFNKLAELQGGSGAAPAEVKQGSTKGEDTKQKVNEEALNRYDLNEMIPTQTLITLKKGDKSEGKCSSSVFLVHPIEGSVKVLKEVAEKLEGNVYGLQCTANVPIESVTAIAAHYLKEVETVQTSGPYRIVGYSLGASIAFEMALQLQARHQEVDLTFLDGSHAYVAAHTEKRHETSDEFETLAMCAFVLQFCPAQSYKDLEAQLSGQKDFSGRLDLVEGILRATNRFPKECELRKSAEQFYKMLTAAASYVPANKYKESCTLIKAQKTTHEAAKLGEDYCLREVVEKDVKIVVVSGDHTSFIQAQNAHVVAGVLNGKQ